MAGAAAALGLGHTLVAGLELAKAGEVVLGQAAEFQGIQLAPGGPEPAHDSPADRSAYSKRR